MASKHAILLDVNVILDVVQQRQPFYEQSARVVDAVVRGQASGWLAAHSIITLFYLINRLRNRQTAVTIITKLLDVFTVATVDDAVIRKALTWGWDDFEDAVQMAAAVSISADYLITRNPRDFQDGGIPVVEPAVFLTLLD